MLFGAKALGLSAFLSSCDKSNPLGNPLKKNFLCFTTPNHK